ncbi:hypothetical protein Tco_0067058 [Tanacetum coccineum]
MLCEVQSQIDLQKQVVEFENELESDPKDDLTEVPDPRDVVGEITVIQTAISTKVEDSKTKLMKETPYEFLKDDQKKKLGKKNEAKTTLSNALPRKDDDSDSQGGSNKDVDEEEEAETYNLMARSFRKGNRFEHGNQFGNGGNRFGKGYGNSFGNKGGESLKQKGACYNYRIQGHFANKALNFSKFKESSIALDDMLSCQKSSQDNEGLGFSKSNKTTSVCLKCDLRPNNWIVDSGCTKHMTGNRRLFTSYKAYDGRHVVFGSNLKGKVVGGGYSQTSKAYRVLNKETMRIEESLNVTSDESSPEPKSSPSVEDDRIDEPIVQDLNGSPSLQVNAPDEGYPKSVKESRADRYAYLDKLNTAYRSPDITAKTDFSQCMTRSLTKELLTPFKNLEREFCLSRKLFKTSSLDKSSSPEFDLFFDLEEHSEEEVTEIMMETVSGQFLKELRDKTFSGSDHEDANEHIEKVLEIVDLFHIPNITQDQIMLRSFPMSLTGAASRWLRNKPSGSITTWEGLKTKFLNKYCPPARTAKKMKEINNFQQELDETLYQAWERFKELLMKCPQHYLTDMQKMAEYSKKWHNGTSRTRSTETSDGLAAIQAQLNNLGREIKKVNEKVYAAQVGCELCKGPYYTKDCPLKEDGKTLKEAYYTRFGVPFQQEGQYRAAAPGFYQRYNANPSYQERRQSMEESLSKFMNELEKRHEENSNLIKEIRASTYVAIRNQGASIKALEIQIGQMSKVLQENGSGSLPSSTKMNPRDHVNSVSIIVETDTIQIRHIRSTRYVVSAQHDSKLIFKPRQVTIPFPSHLYDDCYDEEKGSYELKDLDAHSIGTTLRNDTLPRKEKDPGSFTLPCYINNVCFEKTLADLGASVSVMPLSTYLNLGLGELAHTMLIVELADRSLGI